MKTMAANHPDHLDYSTHFNYSDYNVRLMRGIFKHHAADTFLIDSLTGKTFTFSEIENLSLKGASLLSSLGINKKDKVALFLPNCLEAVLLYFSCMQLGAVPVPINIKLHQKDIQHILSNSQVKILFAETTLKSLLVDIPASKTIFLQTNNPPPELSLSFLEMIKPLEFHHEESFFGINDQDIIVIVYTSGTTNLPKGVVFSYKNMISNAFAFIERVGLNPKNRFYGILSLAYMAGFYNLMLVPFLAGSSIVLDKTFDFSVTLHFWKKIRQYQVNVLWLVPSILSILLSFDCPPEELNYCKKELKLVFSGTAPLPASTKTKFEEKFSLPLYNTYGLSELLFVSINSPLLPYNKGVGKLLSGCRVSIILEGKEESKNKEGEIALASDYFMKYYDSPIVNEVPSHEPGFFLTGDIGYLDEDGFLFITDRKKDLIIRGGINISPLEIEEVLRSHSLVKDVAVVGVPHELEGEMIVAAIDLEKKNNLSEKEIEQSLSQHCRNSLASFKVPNQYFFVDSFPRSVTGKIQKNKLKELVLSLLNRT